MTRNRKLFTRGLPALGLTGVMVASMVSGASASSHREAPLISSDPQADLTDLYAFMSPDAKDTLSLVMNVNPMEQAAGGPNFYKFADDVLYQFNIDNNGDALPDWEYQFRFTTTTLLNAASSGRADSFSPTPHFFSVATATTANHSPDPAVSSPNWASAEIAVPSFVTSPWAHQSSPASPFAPSGQTTKYTFRFSPFVTFPASVPFKSTVTGLASFAGGARSSFFGAF